MTQLDLIDWRAPVSVPVASKPRRRTRPAPTETPEPARAAPVVRWAGGKTALLPDLLARVPSSFGRYFEPFCGGAALFFALAPERAVLGDANADLMACYRALADDVEAVIAMLEWNARRHDREHYERTRRLWNGAPADTWFAESRAAAFIYLNKSCFNGVWRVNRKGEFNVPMGRPSSGDFKICDPDGLRLAAAALQRADLRASDWTTTAALAEAGDFAFFDPPYHQTFTSYTANAFTEDDQRLLAEVAHSLVDRGVHVMLSNSNTPLIRELYGDMQIDVVQRPGTVSSKATKRQAVDEVVITSKGSL